MGANVSKPLYNLDEGRAYVHSKCGGVTIINEKHFASLCNPFGVCLGTMCAQCGADKLSNFRWEDTDEPIDQYRARLRKEASGWSIFNWIVMPLIGTAVGAGAMLAFKAPNITPNVAMLIGAGVGLLATLMFIGPIIMDAVAGSRFYGQR